MILKILAIGDFHGKFPEKLKDKIIKERPEFILCTGDYSGISEWRPYLEQFFKTLQKGIQTTIEKIMGKKKFAKLVKKDYDTGKAIIKRLNNFEMPVFSVFGNCDWYKETGREQDVKRDYKPFVRRLKFIKNIHRGKTNFKGLKIMGFGGYLDNDIYFTEKGRNAIADSTEQSRKRRKRHEKEGKRFMKLMQSKPDIMLLHYTPYRCLDKMKAKGLALSGSNMGINFFNIGIKKYNPFLVVCGHMHENQGICRIGKTLVINAGAASEGKASLISINIQGKKKKVKSVKFIR